MTELRAKVLTVSDGVADGTRDDKSGRALVERLSAAGVDILVSGTGIFGADDPAAAARAIRAAAA